MTILNVQDAAKRLGIGNGTAYSMLRAQKLPGFKLGKSWRISDEALTKWMQAQSDSALRAAMSISEKSETAV